MPRNNGTRRRKRPIITKRGNVITRPKTGRLDVGYMNSVARRGNWDGSLTRDGNADGGR